MSRLCKDFQYIEGYCATWTNEVKIGIVNPIMRMPLWFSTVLLVTFQCVSLPAEGSATDSLALNLKGAVLGLREYSGADESALSLRRTVQFNEKGHPVSEKVFDSTGAVKTSTSFSYTPTGQILEITGSDPDGQVKWRYAYSYDDAGRLSKESSYDSKSAREWWDEYHYNDQSLLVEKLRFSATGKISLQDSYQYNEKKLLTLRTTLYADGKLLKRGAYFYDSRDLLAREDRYDANGLYEQVEYLYGADSLLVSIKNLGTDGTVHQTQQNIYDGAGRLVQEKVIFSSAPVSTTTVTYVYDARGNWTKRSESIGACTTRVFHYSD
jgi:YD repeat-containing protein